MKGHVAEKQRRMFQRKAKRTKTKNGGLKAKLSGPGMFKTIKPKQFHQAETTAMKVHVFIVNGQNHDIETRTKPNKL